MIALGLKLCGQSLLEVVGISGRLATCVLYIFADRALKLQPKIIFSGTPTEEGGRIWADEGHLYAEGVTVEYNKTAYNNERLFKSWIRDKLGGVTDSRDFLLVMDVASFHTTEDVMADLRKAGVTVALIPSGCTGLLQPLDVSVNKPFKQWVREEVERLEDNALLPDT